MLPITYSFAIIWFIRDPATLKWLGLSLVIHWAISMAMVTRTITWRQALIGFPCYWVANWWNKAIYLWTFVREWILGRHYVSWTGRQGRATEIAPMSARRRKTLAALALSMALTASVVTGAHVGF
jgi:hypothetical protein